MALLTYKHKTHVLDNDQRIMSNADVDFYVDNVIFSLQLACTVFYWLYKKSDIIGFLQDVVHIVDGKVNKRFGDYFVRHILKVILII